MSKYMSLLVVYALGVLLSLKFCGGSIVGGYQNRSCIEIEKRALLQLKESLVDDSNYLSSWVGDDCCAWLGISCNNISGHVMQLDLRSGYLTGGQMLPSLLDLKYLTYLDLSFNYFDELQIPNFIGSFKHLVYLNLSCTAFEGMVPHHLGNLSNLQYLDVSSYYESRLSIDSMGWLSGLPLLKHLDVSYVNLSRVTNWFSAINMLPKTISLLGLYHSHLPNKIPSHLPFVNLTSLVTLDLGENLLRSSFPLWVLNNSGLAHLSLGNNDFKGPIPKSIGRLASLRILDLSLNILQGSIPQSFENLTSLSTLDLSFNKLNDRIPLGFGNLTDLTYLNLGTNQLIGFLPETVCQLSKFEKLYLCNTQLSGSIPECIGTLSNLKILGLFSNSWEGILTEHHFVNLTKLNWFYISSKSNLELNFSSTWVPPFQLEVIWMASLKPGLNFHIGS